MFNFFYSDRSPKWREIRSEHIKQQPQCQACYSIKSLEVHHIEPYHINPERELDLNNLITLCKTCHFVFGHLMDYKSWNKNVVEDCKNYSQKIIGRPYNENFGNASITNNIFNKFICWYKRSTHAR